MEEEAVDSCDIDEVVDGAVETLDTDVDLELFVDFDVEFPEEVEEDESVVVFGMPASGGIGGNMDM